jgi:hypothetical protein
MADGRLRIAVLVAAVGLLAVLAAVGPAAVDVAAVCLVFVVGVALGRALPRSVPRVLDAVRPWRLVAAAATVAGAAGILVLPGLARDPDGASRAAQSTTQAAPGRVAAPRAAVEQQRAGRAFVSEGVRFRVFVPGRDSWAQAIRREPRARGTRWVVIGVKATNLGRRRFNGNTLAYRLRAGTRLIAPRFSGGTGPSSLARTGRLARAESSLSRLGFEVPPDLGQRRLAFEPEPGGATQVQVTLDE